jgi:hypothetical protein
MSDPSSAVGSREVTVQQRNRFVRELYKLRQAAPSAGDDRAYRVFLLVEASLLGQIADLDASLPSELWSWPSVEELGNDG